MIKKVLIIEDDREMCQELEEALTNSGFCVELAYDGLEAKKKINKNRFDAIILDLKIPKFDGYQILRYLNKKRIELKIHIITSRMQIHYEDIITINRDQTEIELLKSADSILIKPFNVNELINRLTG